ncbi:MAG TPA: hypothetical protein VF860_08160 [Candidatus Acidoferrales bacterium]
MNAKFFSLCAGILFLTSTSALLGQTPETPNLAGAPPRFLNFVHVQLKPGRASAYASLEAAIVRGYNGAQVDIHWLCLQAITGPSGVLYLNFFNSFEEYEKIFATYGQALAKHPDLLQMQDRLQLENMSGYETVIGVRRDDMGYRAGAIDFSKMRRLRIHEFHVRQGRESDFAEAARIVAAAYARTLPDASWIVYQVDSGTAGSTFLVLIPLVSLGELDNVIAASKSLADAEAEIGGERLPQIGLEAISSIENNMYVVAPEMSHMPKDFTDGDPDFWTPQPSPPAKPRVGGAQPPAKPAAGAPKPPTKPSLEKRP